MLAVPAFCLLGLFVLGTVGLGVLYFIGVSSKGSLIDACVGPSDLGVERLDDVPLGFRCVLTPEGWRRVLDLLEPFLDADAAETRFQHLTAAGSIEWIVSTGPCW